MFQVNVLLVGMNRIGTLIKMFLKPVSIQVLKTSLEEALLNSDFFNKK